MTSQASKTVLGTGFVAEPARRAAGPSRGASKSRRRGRNRKGIVLSYAMILPAFALLALFIVYPFVQGFVKSFYNWNGGNVDKFNGIDNFVQLVGDPLFRQSFINVFILTAALIVQAVAVPLMASWLVHHFKSEKLKYVFRVLVMVPVVVPGVVGFLLWVQFLSDDGAVNRLLRGIGLGALAQNWLGNPGFVLLGLIIVGIPWLNGINTLLYLAAFGNIPKELYEAAVLDGARTWMTFRKVELPHLAGQTKLILFITLVMGLQGYENVYIMTNGGPGDASVVPGLILFRNAFRYGQFGYANAIGLTILVITLGLAGVGYLVTRIGKRHEA